MSCLHAMVCNSAGCLRLLDINKGKRWAVQCTCMDTLYKWPLQRAFKHTCTRLCVYVQPFAKRVELLHSTLKGSVFSFVLFL